MFNGYFNHVEFMAQEFSDKKNPLRFGEDLKY